MKTYRELNIEDIVKRLSSCEDFPTGEFEVCTDEKTWNPHNPNNWKEGQPKLTNLKIRYAIELPPILTDIKLRK